jgi:hypothetical protein
MPLPRGLANGLLRRTGVALTVFLLLVVGLQSKPAVYVFDETEALARVIRSEVGQSSLQHRVHVAWATRNLAAQRRRTIAQLVCSPCGPQELGRPVSSRQQATDSDRQLARHILAAPAILDPTGGATQFIDPALQDELAARSAPGYRGRPYRHVRRQWSHAYGWEPYYRLGPDLELWGPKRRIRTSSPAPRPWPANPPARRWAGP